VCQEFLESEVARLEQQLHAVKMALVDAVAEYRGSHEISLVEAVGKLAEERDEAQAKSAPLNGVLPEIKAMTDRENWPSDDGDGDIEDLLDSVCALAGSGAAPCSGCAALKAKLGEVADHVSAARYHRRNDETEAPMLDRAGLIDCLLGIESITAPYAAQGGTGDGSA
jgi:hypothetical protein